MNKHGVARETDWMETVVVLSNNPVTSPLYNDIFSNYRILV